MHGILLAVHWIVKHTMLTLWAASRNVTGKVLPAFHRYEFFV